jgi:aspartyl/asparaginyl-tRNA synthetase
VTFDARLRSSQKSDLPNTIDLELNFEGTVLKAAYNSEAIGNSAWEDVQKLNPGSLIRITGRIQPSATSPQVNSDDGRINGDIISGDGHKWPSSTATYDFSVTNLVVVAKAFPNQPAFQGGELSGPGFLQHRLDNRILDQRAAASGAIFKLQSGMCQLIVEFLIANGFTWLHTPRIRGSHVAGDNEYFHLPYFGRDSWLTQHTQHALQNAIAMDMHRVFDIGPVFRADQKSSSSARHLSEVCSFIIVPFYIRS